MWSIALTWYMWSWKTTIGGQLARSYQMTFVDLDDETLKLLGGQSIPEFIAEHDTEEFPFPKFRAKESEALMWVLAAHQGDEIVLSTWGGTISPHPYLEANVNMLQDAWFAIVYIQRELDRILQSRQSDTQGNQRRVSVDNQALYYDRHPIYSKYSDIFVWNNGDISQTVQDIHRGFRGFYKASLLTY